MEMTSVNSFSGYVSRVDSLGSLQGEYFLFRGQPVSRNLLPGINRSGVARRTGLESEVFDQLDLLGASLLPVGQQTKLDKLVLAQHYGLKTRLLDWTSNPLVALWFACSSREKGDVFVYALEADSLLRKDVYASDPFENDLSIFAFQPRLTNARITAQNGWFTLHRNRMGRSEMGIEILSAKYLTEIVIPADSRESLLLSLDRHGISCRTLFPDLQGLCEYLNWSMLLKR